MAEAIQAGASAVAAGAMFAFTEQTPKGAARYLAAQGIEARV
jgi:imidazole glycerol phosphate synthase subunit HisF